MYTANTPVLAVVCQVRAYSSIYRICISSGTAVYNQQERRRANDVCTPQYSVSISCCFVVVVVGGGGGGGGVCVMLSALYVVFYRWCCFVVVVVFVFVDV